MRFLAMLFVIGGLASGVPPGQQPYAASVPPSLPYSQDALPAATFDARGTWTLRDVAGFSNTFHLTKTNRRRLLNTPVTISDDTATFWNKKVMQRKPFTFARLGEQTYDTQSREFWFDFRTDPQALKLPRYVASVDLEIGQLIIASPDRMLFQYEGVWYDVSRNAI